MSAGGGCMWPWTWLRIRRYAHVGECPPLPVSISGGRSDPPPPPSQKASPPPPPRDLAGGAARDAPHHMLYRMWTSSMARSRQLCVSGSDVGVQEAECGRGREEGGGGSRTRVSPPPRLGAAHLVPLGLRLPERGHLLQDFTGLGLGVALAFQDRELLLRARGTGTDFRWGND